MFDSIVRRLFPPRDAASPPDRAGEVPRPAVDYDDPRIPEPARDRIRIVIARLLEVEASLRRETGPGPSASDVARIRDVHLPRLVRSYVDIPAAHRSEIFRTTGRSASFALVESLDRMIRHLEVTARDLARHDLDAFTTNIRFVAERFSDGENTFR